MAGMICYRTYPIAWPVNHTACGKQCDDSKRNWAFAVHVVDCPKCRKWLKRNGYL